MGTSKLTDMSFMHFSTTAWMLLAKSVTPKSTLTRSDPPRLRTLKLIDEKSFMRYYKNNCISYCDQLRSCVHSKAIIILNLKTTDENSQARNYSLRYIIVIVTLFPVPCKFASLAQWYPLPDTPKWNAQQPEFQLWLHFLPFMAISFRKHLALAYKEDHQWDRIVQIHNTALRFKRLILPTYWSQSTLIWNYWY